MLIPANYFEDATRYNMSKAQFVLLPKSGLFGSAEQGDADAMRMIPHVQSAERALPARLEMAGRHEIRVLDSVSQIGPKLVEMDQTAGHALAGKHVPGPYRLFHVKYYRPAAIHPKDFNPKGVAAANVSNADIVSLSFAITDSATGKPVVGAKIAAYVDFSKQKGSPPAVTDNSGTATVLWLKTIPTIESLFIFSPEPPVYWGIYRSKLAVNGNFSFSMEPVVPKYEDGVRAFFPKTKFAADSGVLVGIVDTGVAQHPALNLVGGENLVQGEDAGDYGSSGNPHGTHVAGLAGAKGLMQGIAPGVKLRSYRVFGKGAENATNFAILKGVNAAVKDKCDIVNLSLGVNEEDKVLEEAITHARNHGAVVIAAAGNDYGDPVGYPASYPICVAVSTIGRVGTFPKGSQPEGDVTARRGKNPTDFVAAFTNVGTSLDFTGPGVGLISTVPVDTYGQMSGTSMSCPVVSGCAACLLSQDGLLLKMKRDRRRSDTLVAKLTQSASLLGFAPEDVGKGMPAC
jgi:subtilisin